MVIDTYAMCIGRIIEKIRFPRGHFVGCLLNFFLHIWACHQNFVEGPRYVQQ